MSEARDTKHVDLVARGLVVAFVLVAGLVADGWSPETLGWAACVGLVLPWTSRAPFLVACALAVALVLAAARSHVPATLVLGVIGGASLVGHVSSGRAFVSGLAVLLVAGAIAIALDPRASFVGTAHNLVVIAAAGLGPYAMRRSAERRLALARAESDLRQAALRDEVMRELHDVAGYAVVAVLTQLRVVRRGLEREELESATRGARLAEDAAREAMDDLRGLALLVAGARLAPRLDSIATLRRAIAEAVERFPHAELRTGSTELVPRGTTASTNGAIDPEIGALLLRVVQQSLANAAHHAPEHSVVVELSIESRFETAVVSVRVTNRLGSRSERGLGLGLRLLRERVERLDGTLTAEASGPDFVLECRLPMEERRDADRDRR
jgi:signal transduction histidine kinase